MVKIILYHQFAGSIDEKEIEIEQINQIPILLLEREILKTFKENQLNWVIN